MAYSFVQGGQGGGSVVTCVMPAATTAGNLLLGSVFSHPGNTITSPAAPAPPFTKRADYGAGQASWSQLVEYTAIATGGLTQFGWSTTGTYNHFFTLEFSGAPAQVALLGQAVGQTDASSVTAATLAYGSAPAAGALAVVQLALNVAAANTPAGWNLADDSTGDSAWVFWQETDGTAPTCDLSWPTASGFTAMMAVFGANTDPSLIPSSGFFGAP